APPRARGGVRSTRHETPRAWSPRSPRSSPAGVTLLPRIRWRARISRSQWIRAPFPLPALGSVDLFVGPAEVEEDQRLLRVGVVGAPQRRGEAGRAGEREPDLVHLVSLPEDPAQAVPQLFPGAR